MGVQKQDIEIDGVTYSMNTLGAEAGFEALGKLSVLLAGPIAALGKGLEGADLSGGLDMLDLPAETLAEALSQLLLGLKGLEVVALAKCLTKGLQYQGADGKGGMVNFDQYFAGRYGLLIKILAWSIKVNFGSLFAEAPRLQDIASRVGKPKVSE
jgi:hypothetical protein